MRALVTGAAGFIGSHLCDRLVADGHTVRAVDSFTPYYDPAIKRRNLHSLFGSPHFEFLQTDLLSAPIEELLNEIDVVFHHAAQPGVRSSWGADFATYVDQNVIVTQRLLEGARSCDLRRFVYASSSSIYGDAGLFPTTEDTTPQPVSPYGVTKLAAEHLCWTYARNWGVPTVALRYFTVYGPRQRPDMALNRLCRCAITGEPFQMYGDGSQVRDFTYISDVVQANLLSAAATIDPGQCVNISGGSSATLLHVAGLIERISGRPLRLEQVGPQLGDVKRTGGGITKAATLLQWAPNVPVEAGIALEFEWMRDELATDEHEVDEPFG